MKFLALAFIKFYQNNISKFTPSSCRYYPTCSEYAIWQFKTNNFFLAFISVIIRILKCNQLFKGGIDYPIANKKFSSSAVFKSIKIAKKIVFWFVPLRGNKFYVIKSF